MQLHRIALSVSILALCAHARADAAPANCPDGAVTIAAGTVHLGHGTVAPWPDHVETIAAFCIDRDEMSFTRLQACVQGGACTANTVCAGGVAPAAACVTALEADEDCRAFGGSLPTEAQWEYAARGTDARPYPSGTAEPAWSALPQLPVQVEPLADRSPFGVRSMLTNAVEWTRTVSSSADQVMRIVKGSQRGIQPLWARAFLEEHTRRTDVGFRCVYPIGAKTPPFLTH